MKEHIKNIFFNIYIYIYACVCLCVCIYIYASSVQSVSMLKYDILNVCNYQQHLLFAHRSKHKYNSGTQISAVTGRTVHEYVVLDTFHSKKTSSALRFHEQQASPN